MSIKWEIGDSARELTRKFNQLSNNVDSNNLDQKQNFNLLNTSLNALEERVDGFGNLNSKLADVKTWAESTLENQTKSAQSATLASTKASEAKNSATIATQSRIEAVELITKFKTFTVLTSGASLDGLETGKYICESSEVASSLTNPPLTTDGFMLETNNYSSSMGFQFSIGLNGLIYIRVKKSNTWSNWKSCSFN